MGYPGPSTLPSSQIRKSKILAFIEKDLFVLNNYETAPFKNKNHAIECLIPYHIFHLTADDIKFRGSDVEIDMGKELEVMKLKIRNMIEEHSFDDDGFTPQLLLYHEQRYLNSLSQQSKSSSHKKKGSLEKKALCIRIPRTDMYHIYGSPTKIRIKLDKNLE